MSTYKVGLSFATLPDARLISFAEALITSLTGNANYATPAPSLATITTQKDNFAAALANAADGGKTLTAIKNQDRQTLIGSLRLLAGYVEDNGLNDQAILLSSGFEIYSTNYPPVPLPSVPVNLRLTDGNYSGSVQAKVNVAPYAVVYEFRYTKEEDFYTATRWENLPVSTKTTIQIERLTPKDTIWVQVRSINSKGTSEWSDPSTILVR